MLKIVLMIAILILTSSLLAFGEPCPMVDDATTLLPPVASVLGISEEQEAVMNSLREDFEREFRPMQNQLLGKKGELAQLWREANPPEVKILAKQVEIREIQARMEDLSTHYRLKCRRILTQEQRETLSRLANHSRTGRPRVSYGW